MLVGEKGFGEREQMGILHGAENHLKLLEHSVGIKGAFGQKILGGDFGFVHAHNVLHADLHFALIQRRLPAHAHEVVLVEPARQIVRPVPNPPFDLAAAVKQLDDEITIACLGHSVVLR